MDHVLLSTSSNEIVYDGIGVSTRFSSAMVFSCGACHEGERSLASVPLDACAKGRRKAMRGKSHVMSWHRQRKLESPDQGIDGGLDSADSVGIHNRTIRMRHLLVNGELNPDATAGTAYGTAQLPRCTHQSRRKVNR